jgi:2,5-dihydroxypyridine 5,6-dioxygenase
MVIDAPAICTSSVAAGLKEAMLHARSLYRRSKDVRVTSRAGTDLSYRCGEYR